MAVSLELVYTLFTPGPDEAIDPLMLGISAAFLYLISTLKDLTWTAGVAAVLFAVTLALLFLVRQHFIDGVHVREDQAARRMALEEKVRLAMGESQASAELDLVELAEFAWHDRYDELGLPKKVMRDILDGSDRQLATMITLIRAKLENEYAMIHRDQA